MVHGAARERRGGRGPKIGGRVRTDERLREELSYCAPRGIPHSIFTGRLVAPGEPQWLDEDVDLALEWQAEQTISHHCGQPLDESAGNAEGQYEIRTVRCWACYESEKAAAAFDGERYGLTFVPIRKG